MPTGYLVTLGNNALNSGDVVAASQSTFTTATTIGTGSWTWTGTYNGTNYSSISDTGTYYQATDGNVYFVPSTFFPTRGIATATTSSTFTDDATIDGTTGNDSINSSYTDAQGDHVTSGNNTIVAGTGSDTVYAEGGNDSISGGSGNDVLYGDSSATGTSSTTTMSWANQGITDETSVTGGINALSADGNVRVNVSVTQEQNFHSATMETTDVLYNYNALSDTSSLDISGGNINNGTSIGNNQNTATITMDFSAAASGYSDEVSNVTFGIFDLDELSGQFRDQVIVRAYDANGNQIAVTLTAGNSSTITTSTASNGTATATAVTGSGGSGSINAATGFVQVSVAGPVSYITIDYNNTDTAYGAHAIRLGDIQMTTIPSTDGNDNIAGDAGDDVLYGQGGNDTLDGGTGNDTLYGGTGNDTLQGGTGTDRLYGDDGDDVIADSGTTTDYIYGGAGSDSIAAGAGADTVYGGTGNDSMFGNDGNDEMFGDDGNDYVDGDGGNDKLYGGAGDDVIVGDDGNDSMYGGTGSDSIYASSGNNYAEGGDGNDAIYMGTGNDNVFGGNNDDLVYGGAGNDTLSGDAGNDTLFGDAGNDTLTGGAGNDSINGGTGSDRIVLGNSFGVDTIDGSEDVGNGDVDILDASTMTSTITVNMTGAEAGTLTSGANVATFSNIEQLVTGSGADSITGSTGNDTVTTGAGADRVNMGAGNDTINLGVGSATDGAADVVVLQDNSGNDIINGFDAPTANGDGTFTGVDTLDVSALYDLPAGNAARTPVRTNDVVVSDDGTGNAVLTFPNGESVTLMGISPTTANNPFYLNAIGIPIGDGTVEGTAGNDLIDSSYMADPDGDRIDANDAILAGDTGNDDLIYGFGGNDTIVAGDGHDEVYGGTGNDSITGGTGSDIIYGDEGNDTIDGGNDNDTLYGGTGDDKIEGGAGDDIVSGDAGNDSLAGGAGNDMINGGDGNDLLNGGTGEDQMYGGNNDDVLYGDAGNDTLYGDQGEDSVYGGTGNDVLFGGDGNDTLDGGDNNDYVAGGNGNDVLEGGLGNDSLVGGAGNDTLYAGAGNDGLVGSSGDDTFVVTDGWGTDTIEGSETLETNGDTLDLSGVTTNLTVNLTSTNSESGSFSDGLGNSATFVEIENIILGGGNDTVVLNNTTGDYTVQQFTAPTPNGDGTFTGVDVLNVTGLNDAQNNPVNVNDVTVTDDGSGNAVLNFPNGQSLTLIGISPTDADNHFYLNAIGIPLSDGTVSGTTGNDVINGAYTGDPDGDIVDGGDAILSGHANNDDLIEAGAGNDTITAADGNDTIYAGTGNDSVYAGTGNDTIFGEDGNDWILGEAGDDLISGGAGNDTLSGGAGNDSVSGDAGNDIINGGTGNDILSGGEGADRFDLDANFGDDTITGGETGLDNDTILSTQGVDTVTVLTGDEAGTITDGTSTATFTEIEVLDLGAGSDSVDASAANAAITVYGGAGSDVITGSTAADEIYGGDDGDTISGGAGADTMFGGAGDDWFMIEDGFGNDIITGGEANELSGDYILGAGLTGNVTLDLTAGSATDAEDGTLTMDGETITFSEIEVAILGSGDDTVIGSSGNEMVATGGGADTINGGQGDDIFDIGGFDGASDVIILQDDFGNDTIYSFEAPTPNGDGTFTGTDTLDVTALFDKPAADPSRTPVYTNDVTVTDDGMGNAVLNFPNGESITLVGISATDADDPFYLEAIGIPMPDGTVEGTSGDDVINDAYTGDPDGDMVDGDDAILAGDTGNDDLIYGYAGNDTITSYNGDNEIYGGDGNDSIYSGYGDDTLYGDAGDDRIVGSSGNDVIYGGTGDDLVFSGTGNDLVDLGDGDDEVILGDGDDTAYGGLGFDTFHVDQYGGDHVVVGGEGGDDVNGDWLDINTNSVPATVIATGDEAGVATYGTGSTTFSEIETIWTDNGDDTIDLSASSQGMRVVSGGGDDTVIGTSGDDEINGLSGNDTINGGLGADTIDGSNGDDTIVLTNTFGNDVIRGGEAAETDGDTLDGSGLTEDVTVTFTGAEAGNVTNGTDTATFSEIEKVSTGAGDDTVHGAVGAQTVSTGAGNDTIFFAEGDSIDGGSGDDMFEAENFGETTNGTITITGGNGGETSGGGDTLKLGELANLSTLNITSTTVNADGNTSYEGSVLMDDGTILNFSEIENIICFTPGTRIATPRGARDIATLRVGDLVVTRDHGLQPIRWIQQRTVPAMDRFAPIRIRPGVVTGQDHDLLVSPQHRMLFQGYRAELLFGESEVLVAAKHLVDGKLVTQDEGGDVTYIHMMFDEHEVVYAEGAATESFHPGDVGLTAVSDPAREELFALFPELRTNVNGYGQTARRCLKKHEIELLVM